MIIFFIYKYNYKYNNLKQKLDNLIILKNLLNNK